MNLLKILGHLLTIGIFTLIFYGLTSSIAVGSIMGIILALVSPGATIVFLWLLPKLNQPEAEERRRES